MATRISLLFIEDTRLMRDGIEAMLNEHPDLVISVTERLSIALHTVKSHVHACAHRDREGVYA